METERALQRAFRKCKSFSRLDDYAVGCSAAFFAISFLSLRTLGLSTSSLVFNSQLSRPPTCSTERSPCVDTRSLTLVPSASEIKVTFCRLGRNVRLVLLLAWETLLPTCRPLPVSSQTRDMCFYPDFLDEPHGPEERRPLAGRPKFVNAPTA